MQCKALFFFFLLSSSITAQNLVPNGSFEDYISCPQYLDGMEFVEHWYKSIIYPGLDYYHNPSPDYFHECALHPNLGVPQNVAGYMYAFDGVAYSGIIALSANSSFREFLGVEMISSLIQGQTYYCSMRVSKADEWNGNAGIAINGLGIVLSDQEIYSSTIDALSESAVVYFAEIVDESSEWVLLYGEYVAEDEYQYLHIGNFLGEGENQVLSASESMVYAYYYIDDVRVSTEPLLVTSNKSMASMESAYAFPNPFSGLVQFRASQRIWVVEIYTLTGAKVHETHGGAENMINVELGELSQGLYVARLVFEDGDSEFIKIIKNQ